jgi:FkbM family methyltransferase
MCGLAALVAWGQTAQHYRRMLAERAYWYEPSREALDLSSRYGPNRNSRDLEEWIIRDAFQDRRNGVFLDVGANHYRDENNTYFLETQLGWSGIAVDALPEFAEGYVTNRPKTQFVAMFAADVAGGQVRFFVPTDQSSRLLASSTPGVAAKEGYQAAQIEVPTTTLDALLEQAGMAHLDFLSMDIELAEPNALKGFDIDRYHPELVCIEAHPQTRQEILDYFHRHGYVVVGKYLRIDLKNLYFRPAT